MKTYLDCIPCFLRQALHAVRLVTTDETLHQQLMQEVLRAASALDPRQSPPAMGQLIHRRIRELTRQSDPYRQAKQQFNNLALRHLPDFRYRILQSDAPLATAVRLAIAGNIIDMGVNSELSETQVTEVIERALSAPLLGDVNDFQRAIANAERILYLADNAGELVFDRLLIEVLPTDRITLAVRGAPVINDATMEDAKTAGLTDLLNVIHNGSDAPGTILEDCSSAFRQQFEEADLVIAKGQGNYETLSHVNKNIYFALMAKCPVISRELGCVVGEFILQRSTHTSSAAQDVATAT